MPVTLDSLVRFVCSAAVIFLLGSLERCDAQMERAGSAAQASKGAAKLAASDLLTDDQIRPPRVFRSARRSGWSVSSCPPSTMVYDFRVVQSGSPLPTVSSTLRSRPHHKPAPGRWHVWPHSTSARRHYRSGRMFSGRHCSDISTTDRGELPDAGRFIVMKNWAGDGIRELKGHACMPWRVWASPTARGLPPAPMTRRCVSGMLTAGANWPHSRGMDTAET